jgi:hypothetical protein
MVQDAAEPQEAQGAGRAARPATPEGGCAPRLRTFGVNEVSRRPFIGDKTRPGTRPDLDDFKMLSAHFWRPDSGSTRTNNCLGPPLRSPGSAGREAIDVNAAREIRSQPLPAVAVTGRSPQMICAAIGADLRNLEVSSKLRKRRGSQRATLVVRLLPVTAKKESRAARPGSLHSRLLYGITGYAARRRSARWAPGWWPPTGR